MNTKRITDSYHYITALEPKQVLVTIHCHHCDTEYELEVDDLLEIMTAGHVPCECGELINCNDYLLNYV